MVCVSLTLWKGEVADEEQGQVLVPHMVSDVFLTDSAWTRRRFVPGAEEDEAEEEGGGGVVSE